MIPRDGRFVSTLYRSLAALVLLLHVAFMVFVLVGGILVCRWRWVLVAHAPAAIWGAAVEWFGWVCPLTPLENALRRAGGGTGESAGVIERYLAPLVYPADLTRSLQLVLGAIVVVVNVVVYVLVLRQPRR